MSVTDPRGTQLKPGSAAAAIVIAKMRRWHLGLRQAARILDIDASQLSRIIKGASKPTMSQLARLRQFAPHEPEDWLEKDL